jgi:hypothetical protein
MGENDVILTVLTDSMELYESRKIEMREEFGAYTELNAAADDARYLKGVTTDWLQELSYADRRRVHNLKYFTWVEQQGRTYAEIQDQWYDPDYWTGCHSQVEEIDSLIVDFNKRVGIG